MKIVKKIFKINLFIVLSIFICICGLYTYAYLTPKKEMSTIGKIYLYDNKNELIETGSSTTDWVSLDNISEDFKNATIRV